MVVGPEGAVMQRTQRTRRSSGVTQQDYYLSKDHLGSITLVTNSVNSTQLTLSYDAFGQRRNGTDWTNALTQEEIKQIGRITRRGYTGHEHLDNLGLIHMNGRVQDPKLGRFLSADPFVQAPFNRQSFNRYSYVFNSPTNFTDPSGYTCERAQGYTPIAIGSFGYEYDDVNGGSIVDAWDTRRRVYHRGTSPDPFRFMECEDPEYVYGSGSGGGSGYGPSDSVGYAVPGTGGSSTVGGSWSVWDLFGISTAEAQARPPRGGGQGGRGGSNGQRMVPGGGTNVERYIPGGNLRANEQFPRAHVLREHVGRSVSQLPAAVNVVGVCQKSCVRAG